MAETLISALDSKKSLDGIPVSTSKDSIFPRKIEFHLARKPSNPYTSNYNGDFHLETLNPSSESKQILLTTGSSPAAKKSDPGNDFFEHTLDPELTFQITFRRIGAGLANLGNTCFLNSVLQCLTYTEPFAAYLTSGKHKSSCHTAGFCALCAIQNHVRSALQSTGKILSPLHLVKNLRCISRNFRNSRQEDAHEYMVNLLESMHKCCLPSGVSSESPSAYEKSLVHKIFGGRLRSQVKCTQCSYCSNKFDPFLDLSLEIVKADSLRKALAHFTAMEQLDGGQRQYQCQRCKEKVRALKQLTVFKAPYVLTIHLKRFSSHVPGQKIDKRVEFGPTLDLRPFVSGPYEGDLKYTLYGVLVHAGWSTHSGHYYCFVRTSSGMWYSLDDNRVVQVSEKAVLEQKAYMLFYVRDRGSAAPKKSHDAAHTEKAAANSRESNGLTAASTGSTNAIQNGYMKGSLVDSKHSSVANMNLVSSKSQTNPSLGTSSKKSRRKEASSLQGSAQIEDTQNSTSLKKPASEIEKLTKSILIAENGRANNSLLNDTSVSESSRNPGNENRTEGNTQEPGKETIAIVSQKNAKNECGDSSKQLIAENGVLEDVELLNEMPCNSPCKTKQTKASSQSITSNGCIEEKSFDGTDDHLPQQSESKPKKLTKCPVRSMYFGRKQLFLASLAIKKKKKHKRSKKRSLDIKKLSERDVLGGVASTDPGTSTSLKISEIDDVHVYCGSHQKHRSPKKRKGSREAKSTNTNDCINGTTKIEERVPEKRSGPHCAVLATGGPVGTSSTIERSQLVQDRRESEQCGLLNMLTRGLEMPTVASWDGIDAPPSGAFGYSYAENQSIGYVLDEWDAEYDLGKRKKLGKFKQSFGGPNLFQEVATEKARKKKMKMTMDRTSAGNQPFRI